jgi:hypothetical protein
VVSCIPKGPLEHPGQEAGWIPNAVTIADITVSNDCNAIILVNGENEKWVYRPVKPNINYVYLMRCSRRHVLATIGSSSGQLMNISI